MSVEHIPADCPYFTLQTEPRLKVCEVEQIRARDLPNTFVTALESIQAEQSEQLDVLQHQAEVNRVNIVALQSTVNNGLSSDVAEIKEIVGHIKFVVVKGLPVMGASLAILKGLGVI